MEEKQNKLKTQNSKNAIKIIRKFKQNDIVKQNCNNNNALRAFGTRNYNQKSKCSECIYPSIKITRLVYKYKTDCQFFITICSKYMKIQDFSMEKCLFWSIFANGFAKN